MRIEHAASGPGSEAAKRKSLRVQPTPPIQFKARKVITIHSLSLFRSLSLPTHDIDLVIAVRRAWYRWVDVPCRCRRSR